MPAASSTSSSPPRPLFLVDDDEVDRMLFGRLVREAAIPNRVEVFETGEKIIDALIMVLRGATPPLACFLDVRMPGVNGFDVLRWVRCQHVLDDVAVVMLSSSEETQHVAEAGHFGAQCYLAKFPTAEQLRVIVTEAERVVANTSKATFRIPCNLLLGHPEPIC